MTLFEFIAKKDQKHLLYKDKAVCLCFYRYAFNQFEQQVLLRLSMMTSIDNENFDLTSWSSYNCVLKIT